MIFSSKSDFFLTLILLLISHNCFAFEGIDIPDYRPFREPAVIKIQKKTLYFDGQITPESALETINYIKKIEINRISINSMGGDGEWAIKLGKEIHKRKISIDVRTVCASACANYIFVAGKHKFLSKNSFLLWHGSINGPEKEMTIRGDISKKDFFLLDAVKNMQKDEIEFYNSLKINDKLPYCPQLEPDYAQKFPEHWFSYKPSDLERFGIKGVHYDGSPTRWVSYAKRQRVIFANYCK
jgi:hypothetical protein